MKKQRQLLYESKREWQTLMLETRLRAYREEYGEDNLNEVFGALKKAGKWLGDTAAAMFGIQTSKQKKRSDNKAIEKKAKEEYKKIHGNLKGFGKGFSGSKGTVKTWGQLKDVIVIAQNVKKLEKVRQKGAAAGAGARALGHTASALLSFVFPALGLGAAAIDVAVGALSTGKNLKDAVMTTRDASDAQTEDSPLLDLFKIDDGYQDLVDDKKEDEFLKWFSNYCDEKMEGNPDEPVPDLDINEIFEIFLRKQGDYDETVTDAESDTKLSEIPYNGEPEEIKNKFNTVSRAVGGFIDEFL